MNRKIKFRAWAKDVKGRGPMMWEWDIYRSTIADWLINTPPNVVLMQFTGLKDKNGKEIYEGDVLRVDEYRRTKSDYQGHTGVVEYCAVDCAGYRLQMIGMGNNEGLWNFSKVEIIGNVYENPELLDARK